jgi:outer membrane protein TolC
MTRNAPIGFLLFLLTWCSNSAVAEEVGRTTLDLEGSIAIALEQSAFIHSAQKEVVGAEYNKKSAVTEFFPKLKTGYSYTRLNEPVEFKQGELGEQEVKVTTVPEDNYSWTFSAEQPLFVGGSIVNNYKLAKLGIDIAEIQEDQAELDLILQVKEGYFGILKAEKLLEVAIQAETQISEHTKVAEAFYNVGMTPRNDLLEAQVELAQAKQDRISAENDLKIAQSRFNTILRRPINAPVGIEDILFYKPYGQTIEECIEASYVGRPEILEAIKNIERTEKEVDVSESNYFPDVYLRFEYERLGDDRDLDGTDTQDPEHWQIMTSLDWTFWEWGKWRYEVGEDRVRVSQAEDGLIQIRDEVVFEVKEAYLNLHEAEESIFVAQSSIEQAEENYRMNEARYKEQVATTTDVLDAQVLLTKSQNNYYNALSDFNIAHARLERAMGHGLVTSSSANGRQPQK